ncbi:hypothetical protein MMC27_001319 [Xylographa pallens]|nr:hypothetical protein [Xylographa pallens]
MVTLSGALSPVGAPIDDPNDWPLLFTEPSTHLCYDNDLVVSTIPYADDPTASPGSATPTISGAIFTNATGDNAETLSVVPNDAIRSTRTTTTHTAHVPSATHRGAAAGLSPIIQFPLFIFALFPAASLFGQWSLLPVTLLTLSLGANSQLITSDTNNALTRPTTDTYIPPPQYPARSIATVQDPIAPLLLTSTTTISNVHTTTHISTVTAPAPATAVLAPRSPAPPLDERSGAVAAGGALVAIAAASTAAPLPPSIPAPFCSLVAFVAATALGPWGMLPVALVLLGLGVNGEEECPPPGLDWEFPPTTSPEANSALASPDGAKRAVAFGPRITSTASASSSTPARSERDLVVTLTTSLAPAAPTATATACVCEECSCASLQAWKRSALVFGSLVGWVVLGLLLGWLWEPVGAVLRLLFVH